MKTRTELGALVVTGALVAAATWIRLRALQVSPYPTGVDGYWYLIQVRSLLEQGRLYYPSAPLVPCLMTALSLILDPVLAVKVIAALGTAALVVPAYAIARRISGAAGPALRLAIALLNDAANDDHLRVVELLLDGRRGLTMKDCHECFHPKQPYAGGSADR